MKCTECGAENAADAKFCKSCGEILKSAPSKENILVTDRVSKNNLLLKDRFRIIKKLGKGGMGEVLLAEDIRLKRKVAIKSILALVLSDTSSKIRFLREAQVASQLDHPNICTIYEIYEEEDHDYIVMQYIDGVTIDQIIKLKSLSVNKVLDIAIQICNGMIEANSEDIIHRDIKPGNIMVDKKGVVKILDFGLAKFCNESMVKGDSEIGSNLTEKGIVLGTVSYLSPEQASGKPLDLRTDIFSAGILLYEMLEGKNPFKEDEQISTLYNVLNKEIHFEREIPEELKEIIRKALEKDKKKRYTSFSLLKDALEKFRLNYAQLKEEHAADAGTEIIDYRERKKLLKEMQKISDKEELGDLVNRIKRFKASTEPVYPTGSKKIKWVAITFFVVLILIAGFYFLSNIINKKENIFIKGTGSKFYVYLHPFENKTGERSLSTKLNYLLAESLNQFKEFKVINREEASSMMEKKRVDKINLKELGDKFKISYELIGKITVFNDFYTIEGRLSPVDKNQKEQRLTITGIGKDSLLINQVDNLAKRVYKIFFPAKDFNDINFRKISPIFGNKWDAFSNFYEGYLYKNRLEADKARKYLLNVNHLLISKYILADLFYFEGNRSNALKRLNNIMPNINFMTEPMKYRVLALKARLNFDFNKEIENLEKLKNDFQFSKEVFLELGNAYFHHGNAEKALEYYNKSLELNKNYSKALNRTGYCYSYLGNHTKAIEAFEDYRRLDQSANSFDSLGDGYFYSGELISSESLKELAVSTDKRSVPWAYLTLADINISKALYQKAESSLREYNRIEHSKEDNANVLAKKAYIYYVNKGYEKALKSINQSLNIFDSKDINDNTAEAHWLKGLISLALNEDDDSHLELDWLKDFKDKYKLSKDNFSSPFKLYIHLEALLLEKDGYNKDADGKFRFLIGMKPRLSYWITYYNYQFFHTEYAKFLERNQKDEDALKEVEQCLEFNRNYIPALWVKADILEKLNDDQRFYVYNIILELYGESTEENYLRDLLKEKLKKNNI